MGTTAYGGKGSKGRAANGDRLVGAAKCRREQHPLASCQNPPSPPLPILENSTFCDTCHMFKLRLGPPKSMGDSFVQTNVDLMVLFLCPHASALKFQMVLGCIFTMFLAHFISRGIPWESPLYFSQICTFLSMPILAHFAADHEVGFVHVFVGCSCCARRQFHQKHVYSRRATRRSQAD